MFIDLYITKPVLVKVFHLSRLIVDEYEAGVSPLPDGIIPTLSVVTDRPDGQYEYKGWVIDPGDYVIMNSVTHAVIEIVDEQEFTSKYQSIVELIL